MARYRVVPERSKIWADARSSLHPISLETTGLEGLLEMTIVDGHIDTNAPVSGSVELDASLLKTGNGLYDRELERKLEMRKYPRVRGRVISVKALDSGTTYRVQGELSLRGQTSRCRATCGCELSTPPRSSFRASRRLTSATLDSSRRNF